MPLQSDGMSTIQNPHCPCLLRHLSPKLTNRGRGQVQYSASASPSNDTVSTLCRALMQYPQLPPILLRLLWTTRRRPIVFQEEDLIANAATALAPHCPRAPLRPPAYSPRSGLGEYRRIVVPSRDRTHLGCWCMRIYSRDWQQRLALIAIS